MCAEQQRGGAAGRTVGEHRARSCLVRRAHLMQRVRVSGRVQGGWAA